MPKHPTSKARLTTSWPVADTRLERLMSVMALRRSWYWIDGCWNREVARMCLLATPTNLRAHRMAVRADVEEDRNFKYAMTESVQKGMCTPWIGGESPRNRRQRENSLEYEEGM